MDFGYSDNAAAKNEPKDLYPESDQNVHQTLMKFADTLCGIHLVPPDPTFVGGDCCRLLAGIVGLCIVRKHFKAKREIRFKIGESICD